MFVVHNVSPNYDGGPAAAANAVTTTATHTNHTTTDTGVATETAAAAAVVWGAICWGARVGQPRHHGGRSDCITPSQGQWRAAADTGASGGRTPCNDASVGSQVDGQLGKYGGQVLWARARHNQKQYSATSARNLTAVGRGVRRLEWGAVGWGGAVEAG